MNIENNQRPTLTGAEILWATLVGEGTTTIFGYPCGAIPHLYDSLHKSAPWAVSHRK